MARRKMEVGDEARREAGKAFMQVVWGDRFDLNDEHFKDTPLRFIKMLRELTDPEPFDFTTFESSADEMIVVKDIDFVSLCAHHIVPFMGKCHIGYVPAGRIAGLSKFPRLVRHQAKTLTVQEELTNNIANKLLDILDPKGIAVVMEAEHLCMSIRGVQSPGTKTITSSMKGVFADHNRLARSEFMALIKED
jgi:GTP cyclohydrolase I